MARCNLRRLLCLPNQQFCLHCYCSHQTLQMYISDIMPPLQDRSHMAVLSSARWSRVWIFYIPKVNSICSTFKGPVESWVYSNNDVACAVTCRLIHAYHSHPRGAVDGLISQEEICPAITQKQPNTRQSAWRLHCIHVSPVLHYSLYTIRFAWVLSALAQTFPRLFSLTTPPPPSHNSRGGCFVWALPGEASSSTKPRNE